MEVARRDYLLTGRTGVGKASFINYLLRQDAAEVHAYRPCTSRLEHYDLPGVRLHDSPGLAEAGGRNDDTYLGMVESHIENVRLYGLVYITPLSEPRFREEEQNALLKLTTRLSAKVWKSAWLVLTFAADVPAERKIEAARHRLGDLNAFLGELTAMPGFGPRFDGFRAVLLVDNVVESWTNAGRPLLEFFAPPRLSQAKADGNAPLESLRELAAHHDQHGPMAESYYPFVRYWEKAAPKGKETCRPGA
jgi:hypothetical protein